MANRGETGVSAAEAPATVERTAPIQIATAAEIAPVAQAVAAEGGVRTGQRRSRLVTSTAALLAVLTATPGCAFLTGLKESVLGKSTAEKKSGEGGEKPATPEDAPKDAPKPTEKQPAASKDGEGKEGGDTKGGEASPEAPTPAGRPAAASARRAPPAPVEEEELDADAALAKAAAAEKPPEPTPTPEAQAKVKKPFKEALTAVESYGEKGTGLFLTDEKDLKAFQAFLKKKSLEVKPLAEQFKAVLGELNKWQDLAQKGRVPSAETAVRRFGRFVVALKLELMLLRAADELRRGLTPVPVAPTDAELR